MARPLRNEFAGALYHVTSRGNERRPIFRNDHYRRTVKRKLARAECRDAATLELAEGLPVSLGEAGRASQNTMFVRHPTGYPALLRGYFMTIA
jgi:hypothetical protein